MEKQKKRHYLRELGFRKWFVEVFWYHYKWPVIAVVLLAFFLVAFILLSRDVRDADMIVVLAVSEAKPAEFQNDIKLEIGRIIGDRNHDGEIIINLIQYIVNPVGGMDESIRSHAQSMTLSLLNDDFSLYLFDQVNANAYCPPNTVQFNTALAAEYGGEHGLIPLGGMPLAAPYGLTGDKQLYAAVKSPSYTYKGTAADFERPARMVIESLLGIRPAS